MGGTTIALFQWFAAKGAMSQSSIPALPSNFRHQKRALQFALVRRTEKRMRIRPWMMSLVLENVDFSWWLWKNPGISWSNACKPPPSAGPRPKPPFRQVQVSFEPARLDPPHKLLKWRKAVGRELCHSVTKLWCIAPASPTSQSVSRGPSPRRSHTPSVPCGRPAPPRSS